MQLNHLLPLQRLIGKVDNDFNIDNSDWIPRAAAWTIDALAQLKCLPYDWRRVKLEVTDRKAYIPNICDNKYVKVYTSKGCQIRSASEATITHSEPLNQYNNAVDFGKGAWSEEEIAIFTGDKDIQNRLKVGYICKGQGNFIITSNNYIELNFDTDWIVVEYYGVATYYDEYFNEDVPFIYDNGDLIEAVSWYILYKMLSRGYKHQVFSLTGQEPVNPYIQWTKLKDKAAASVKHDLRDVTKSQGWNNFFYNSTFLPRK